jgi:hypothetical protein
MESKSRDYRWKQETSIRDQVSLFYTMQFMMHVKILMFQIRAFAISFMGIVQS